MVELTSGNRSAQALVEEEKEDGAPLPFFGKSIPVLFGFSRQQSMPVKLS